LILLVQSQFFDTRRITEPDLTTTENPFSHLRPGLPEFSYG
jgi:hypothetical protein